MYPSKILSLGQGRVKLLVQGRSFGMYVWPRLCAQELLKNISFFEAQGCFLGSSDEVYLEMSFIPM